MNIDDPIIEEIHRIREAIAQRFNNDLHAICEEARRQQAASGQKPVSFPPRPVEPDPRNQRERQVDMGVIMPTKVERTALQNAASISGLLLTTDAIISEIKEDKPEPAGAPGGGMY